MTTEPCFDEAVKLSKDHGLFDKVGLHLNLDEGEPLSIEMLNNSHFCSEGKFRERVFVNPRFRFFLNRYDRLCVKQEITAQMTKYLDAGFTLRHFDSHHFVHNNLSVIFLVSRIGKRFGFKSTRLMEIRLSDSLFRKTYKILLNNFLRNKFNTSGQFLQLTECFDENRGSIEFMVHPKMVDSELVDVVSWNPERYVKFEEYVKFISRVKAL